MKKISTLITGLLLTAFIYAQNLDTVTVNLTLRSQDWAWLVGKLGAGGDSTERTQIRSLRAQMIAANPTTWTENVQVTGIKGRVIIWMYSTYCSAGFQEIINMGSNIAERTTIWTNIRALSNSAIQYYIGVIDGNFSSQFINTRQSGKSILLDN